MGAGLLLCAAAVQAAVEGAAPPASFVAEHFAAGSQSSGGDGSARLASLVRALREWLAGSSPAIVLIVLGPVAAALPRSGAAAALLAVILGDSSPLVGAGALAAGWGSRALGAALIGLRRGEARPSGAAGSISQADWSRRLARAPFIEGFSAALLDDRRAEAAFAAGVLRSVRGAAGVAAAIALGAALLAAFAAALHAVGAPSFILRFGPEGLFGLLVAVVVLRPIAAGLPSLLTRRGRARADVALDRARRHEFGPAWLFYLPFVPLLLLLALRHRGLGTFSCCNPGIEHGGGIVGESKAAIMHAFDDPDGLIAPTLALSAEGSAPERAARLAELRRAHPRELALPFVLKPDSAQRGFGFKVVRREEEILPYLEQTRVPLVAQPFHPGPVEVGVLWVRRNAPCGPTDSIFSITRKDFPVLVGDGEHTLEELVYRHPRYRLQWRIFLARFRDQQYRVLLKGERLGLAVAGNHCQGTLFRDGADLLTPQLAAAIDRLARGFRGIGGGELDFARFDLRCDSEENLRAARGLCVIEVNGTFGESTNMYDPERSALWAYGVLFRQWRLLFRLGAARRAAGVRPMGFGAFLHLLWTYYRGRSGSELAD